MLTFIEISRRQRYSHSSAFIRLLTQHYKRQGRAGNGNSERIQSVLCEENNCDLKTSVIKIFGTIVIVYREECKGFIRLLTQRYKTQDTAGNGNSERIPSVLCEDILSVKRIIVV